MQIDKIVISFSTEYLDMEVPQEYAFKIDQIRKGTQVNQTLKKQDREEEAKEIGGGENVGTDEKKVIKTKKVTMTEAIEGQVTTTGEYQFSCSSSDS